MPKIDNNYVAHFAALADTMVENGQAAAVKIADEQGNTIDGLVIPRNTLVTYLTFYAALGFDSYADFERARVEDLARHREQEASKTGKYMS